VTGLGLALVIVIVGVAATVAGAHRAQDA